MARVGLWARLQGPTARKRERRHRRADARLPRSPRIWWPEDTKKAGGKRSG